MPTVPFEFSLRCLHPSATHAQLLANTQRPRYLCACSIGSWDAVLSGLSVAATLTNLGVIAYTSTSMHRLLPFHFIGVEINDSNATLFLFVCEHIVIGKSRAVVDALALGTRYELTLPCLCSSPHAYHAQPLSGSY